MLNLPEALALDSPKLVCWPNSSFPFQPSEPYSIYSNVLAVLYIDSEDGTIILIYGFGSNGLLQCELFYAPVSSQISWSVGLEFGEVAGGVSGVLTEKVRQGVAVECMSFVQLTFYSIK